MAAVTKDLVRDIASLARLDITEGQDPTTAEKTLERFARQFADIVTLMDTLAGVDTESVEPLYQPLAFTPAPLREDVAERLRTREDVLKNAPEQDGTFFIVPKIM